MADPITDIVTLLQPGAPFTKRASGAGSWIVRRVEFGRPFYAVVLDGACRLEASGHEPLRLDAGDFVLIPTASDFSMSSPEPPPPGEGETHAVGPDGEIRHGDPAGPPDVRMLVGYCTFASPDADLLVSLLPEVVHVRDVPRLSTLVELVRDESRAQRPGREVVVARLVEVLLIEAFRYVAATDASPGLLRGLADDRLAAALRQMHGHPGRAWTVEELAAEAALSRSAFFDRFKRVVGVAPMAYLLGWRMTLAKDLLGRGGRTVAEVAERVGYGSASAFSVAFAREVGRPPVVFAREGPPPR